MKRVISSETIETALKNAEIKYDSSDIEKLSAVLNDSQFISSLTGVIIDEIDRKRSNKVMSSGKKAKSILDL